MRLAGAALLLLIRHVHTLIAKLCDDSAQERCRIVQIAQYIHKALVVKTKAGEMLNLLHIRHLLEITGAKETHDLIFLAGRLDRTDDFGTLLPLLNKTRDHFHRILEITAQADRAVTARLADSVIRRVELSEILCIKDCSDL